ncbi:MAG: phosphotransferase [Lachnospiraceae bacterium]|nr:phosphotransferase [Lachnospiraceae bacterium]
MDRSCFDIFSQYTDENIEDVRGLNAGHINETMYIRTDEGNEYVLQSVNASLYGGSLALLEDNYLCYKAACETAGVRAGQWICPEWIRDRSGQFFYEGKNETIYRLYRYIQGDTADSTDDDADPYVIGKGLGTMHRILDFCDKSRIRAALPYLHDLSYYYEQYRAVNADPDMRDESLDEVIFENINRMLAISVPKGQVIHGDAKAGNMIVDSRRVKGFIDLDTLMQGSVFDDLADCIRSACLDAKGGVIREKADALIQGYEKGKEGHILPAQKDLIYDNVLKHRFMLGLRYYTDCLAGNLYFKENCPGESLKKARKLLTSI